MVAHFNKPGVGPEDTRIWTYDAAVVEITGIPADADLALLDYPGDRVDFYDGAAVGILADDYEYGDGEVIEAGTLVILGTYRGDPVYNYVEIQARYSTTPEAGEVTTIERTMSGEVYLLVEIPEDGAVSDTSDGFFIFVPNLEDEAALNAQDGVSQTLWISFPDGGDDEDQVSLPVIELKSDLS